MLSDEVSILHRIPLYEFPLYWLLDHTGQEGEEAVFVPDSYFWTMPQSRNYFFLWQYTALRIGLLLNLHYNLVVQVEHTRLLPACNLGPEVSLFLVMLQGDNFLSRLFPSVLLHLRMSFLKMFEQRYFLCLLRQLREYIKD